MSDPLKLAEEIENGRDLHANIDEHFRLIAAALRLAAETDRFEQTSAEFPDIEAESTPPDYRPWLRVLAAYRAAKEDK